MIRCLSLIIMVATSSTTSLTIPSYTTETFMWTSPLLRLVWSSMSHLQPSHNNLLRSTLKPDHNFKIIPNLARPCHMLPLGQLLIHELREYPFQTHSSRFKVQREANVKAFSLGRKVYWCCLWTNWMGSSGRQRWKTGGLFTDQGYEKERNAADYEEKRVHWGHHKFPSQGSSSWNEKVHNPHTCRLPGYKLV